MANISSTLPVFTFDLNCVHLKGNLDVRTISPDRLNIRFSNKNVLNAFWGTLSKWRSLSNWQIIRTYLSNTKQTIYLSIGERQLLLVRKGQLSYFTAIRLLLILLLYRIRKYLAN